VEDGGAVCWNEDKASSIRGGFGSINRGVKEGVGMEMMR
jgi:hypothetical protein